jgi:hypothetical protein
VSGRATAFAGVAAIAIATTVGVAGPVACDDPSQHVYSGQLFDPQAQCVESSSTGLDVIGGAATGDTCAPACLVASSQVYVSTVCPPYPPAFTVEAADATAGASDPCTAALAAFAAGNTCGADASTESGPGDDGGEEGGPDAPEDAQADGSDAG